MKLLVALMLLITNSVYAFSLSEAWNQSSYGEFINNKAKNIHINTGIGSYQNRMNVDSSHYLNTTNNIFFLIGAKLNKARLQVNIPNPTTAESKQTRVDTQFNVYSLGYDINDSLSLTADYFNIKGFYHDSLDQNSTSPNLKFPDLRNTKATLTGFYTFNDEHTSFITEPLVFDKRNDTSSWILISKISSVEMSGLNALSALPNSTQFAKYNSTKAYSLEASFGYSKNLFWANWFLGGALGFGLNANSIKTEYTSGDSSTRNKMGSSYFLSISTGYIWTRAKLAAFSNQHSSKIELDDVSLDNNGGTSGIYFGYSF